MSTLQTQAQTAHLDLLARGMSSCDALGAVAHHVSRYYGDYGYRIGQISSADFVVRHSDGSTFVLRVDRCGNVARLGFDALAETYGREAAGRNA